MYCARACARQHGVHVQERRAGAHGAVRQDKVQLHVHTVGYIQATLNGCRHLNVRYVAHTYMFEWARRRAPCL